MKPLIFIAATACAVALAEDAKPKEPPTQSALTAAEHDELTKLFVIALSNDNTRLAALIEGKLGVDALNASNAAWRDYNGKRDELKKAHNVAQGCTWAFFDKQWACPPVAQSEIDAKQKPK